ncbi:MAG: cation transporting ATPase C-terminal domain-containing protein [Desulfotomaculaceae bacterium]
MAVNKNYNAILSEVKDIKILCFAQDGVYYGLDRTLFNNPVLWGAIVLVLGLQFLAVYQPLLNRVLQTVPLDVSNVIMATVASLATLVVIQVLNKIKYMRAPA